MAAIHLRKVRSFVRRPGRVTQAQRRALEVGTQIHTTPEAYVTDLDQAVFDRINEEYGT